MPSAIPRLLLVSGTALVGVGALFLFFHAKRSPTASLAAANFGGLLCDDAWQNELDYSGKTGMDHFILNLREGCFSGWVTLPDYWQGWSMQHAPGTKAEWIALWPSGESVFGPVAVESSWAIKTRQKKFRVEGKGSIVWYTKSAVPPGQAADASRSVPLRRHQWMGDSGVFPWLDSLNFDNRVCNDAVDKSAAVDKSDFGGDWFDIVLREGCYGPTVWMPDSWNWWRHQSANDEQGWVSWVTASGCSTQPVKLNQEPRACQPDMAHEFRLQGKGTIRFIKIRGTGEKK